MEQRISRLISAALIALAGASCAAPTQEELAMRAIGAGSWRDWQGVEGIDDQALLARVAIESRSTMARVAAARKLEDLELLDRIAGQDPEALVRLWADCRRSALRKDMAALARIVRETGGDVNPPNRTACRDALGHLTDPDLLAEVATAAGDREVLHEAIARLEADPARLRRIRASLPPEDSAAELIALLLFLRDPAIQARAPGAAARFSLARGMVEDPRVFSDRSDHVHLVRPTESLSCKIVQGDAVLAEGEWRSKVAPPADLLAVRRDEVQDGEVRWFIPSGFDPEPLAAAFLGKIGLPRDGLAAIAAGSHGAAIRCAAIGLLDDREALAPLLADPDERVRRAAAARAGGK